MRVVDWTGAAMPAGFLFLLSFFGYALFFDQRGGFASTINPTFAAIIVVLAIVGLADLAIKLRGAYFDLSAGKVCLPGWLPISVRLAEIRDANCDMQLRANIWSLIGVVLGRSFQSKLYAVNISGEFGSHAALFASKWGRDHFLSGLREYAPQCRITRYYRPSDLEALFSSIIRCRSFAELKELGSHGPL